MRLQRREAQSFQSVSAISSGKLRVTANEEMKFKVGSIFVLVKYMEAASATIGGSLNASQEHKFLSSLG